MGFNRILDGYSGSNLVKNALVEGMGMTPVVPPKSNRKTCKFRNEIEQLFRKLKGCRRIFMQFDKLDVTFAGFLNFARAVELIYDLA